MKKITADKAQINPTVEYVKEVLRKHLSEVGGENRWQLLRFITQELGRILALDNYDTPEQILDSVLAENMSIKDKIRRNKAKMLKQVKGGK